MLRLSLYLHCSVFILAVLTLGGNAQINAQIAVGPIDRIVDPVNKLDPIFNPSSSSPSPCNCPTTCDCSKILMNPDPVCGVDGVVYINACVAQCQKVEVTRMEVCQPGRTPTGGSPTMNERTVDVRAVIDGPTLYRFFDEGFKFQAKFFLDDNGTVEELFQSDRFEDTGLPNDAFALRFTPEGHAYIKLYKPNDCTPEGNGREVIDIRSFNGSMSNDFNTQDSRRKLIVGADDRVETLSHDFPWRTIGYIATGCSGALIAPRTVLTAGHCVYDAGAKKFYGNLNFFPTRHGGGGHYHGTTWYPDRQVNWQWSTTYWNNAGAPQVCSNGQVKCHPASDFRFDFAVIRLAEDVGNQYGWLGYGYACATKSYAVTTAGYPSDRAGWPTRKYKTTGTLNSFYGCAGWSDTGNGYVSSNLDTAPGQSGSAIWDSGYIIRATHSSGLPGHRTMTKWVYDNVHSWAV